MPPSRTIRVLKKRSEYLSVASHRKRWVTPAFVLQIAPHPESTDCGLGLTTSKKMVGNLAVDRNRARRRLRALAREILSLHGKTGYDYVVLARKEALTESCVVMRKDFEKALKRLDLWDDGKAA